MFKKTFITTAMLTFLAFGASQLIAKPAPANALASCSTTCCPATYNNAVLAGCLEGTNYPGMSICRYSFKGEFTPYLFFLCD